VKHPVYVNISVHDWLYEKAVCTPRNLDVIDNNLKMQKSQPGNVNVYKSVDALEDVNEAMQYQRTDTSPSHL
jgi:hypothetical protein